MSSVPFEGKTHIEIKKCVPIIFTNTTSEIIPNYCFVPYTFFQGCLKCLTSFHFALFKLFDITQ